MASCTFEFVTGNVVVQDGLKSEMAYKGMSVPIYGSPILVVVAHGAKADVSVGGKVFEDGSGGVLRVGVPSNPNWAEMLGTLPGATMDQLRARAEITVSSHLFRLGRMA